MANENLFPNLDWSNWDNLNVASNQQRFSVPSVTQEQLTALMDDINKRFPPNVSDAISRQRVNAINQLREGGKMSSYNYVPPRHALEPHMGFEINPKNAYRFMGERIPVPIGADPSSALKDKTLALQDFLNTGQVRGNPTKVNGGRVYSAPTQEAMDNYWKAMDEYLPKLNRPTSDFKSIEQQNRYIASLSKPDFPQGRELPQAYFMPRHPQPTYYINSDLTPQPMFAPVIKSGKPTIINIPNDGAVGQNTMIEISKDFAPINQTVNPSKSNPLYYMGNQNGNDAQQFRLNGGKWAENTGAGTHITVNPRENPSFFDVANPANRKGIRILQESAPALSEADKISVNNRAIYGKITNLVKDSNGYESGVTTNIPPNQTAGTAPEASKIKWTTKYDRITPFSQRPVATHIANAKAEAEIFLNAAKTRPLSTKIGSLGAAAGKMGALSAVGKVAGGVFAPVQIGMQINALNKDNVMDKEYGHSDPFAFRPAIDFALSGIGLNQTPAQGWKSMGNRVADPEWQMRNPISAVPYNLIHGNLEPLKAFAEGYIPSFLK